MPSFRTLSNLPVGLEEKPAIISDVEVYLLKTTDLKTIYVLEYRFYPSRAILNNQQAFKVVCQVRDREKPRVLNTTSISDLSIADSIMNRSNLVVTTLNEQTRYVLNEFQSDPTRSIPNNRLNNLASYKKQSIKITEQFTVTQNVTDLFIYVSVKNKQDLIVQEEKLMIPHQKYKNLFENMISKSLICLPAQNNVLGRNIFYVQQSEGKGFSLFRKNKQTNKYEFIKNYYASGIGNEVYKVIDETTVLYHDIQYRVVPFVLAGSLVSDFTDVVISSNRKQSKPQPFIHLFILDENKVRVDFFNITTKIKSIVLYRNNQIIKLFNPQNNFTFIDDLVQQGKIYKYSFEYYDGFGNKFSSTTENNIRVPISTAPEKINLTTRISEISQQDNNITFVLTSEFLESVQTKLKTFIGERGFGLFEESINLDDLQGIVSYQIIRQNITTGEQEDLGVLTNTNRFDDKRNSELMGAKLLVPKNQYRYIINTFVRNIITLLPNYVVTDSSVTGVEYSYSPYKWLNPVILNQGTIIFSNEQQRNFAYSPFTISELSRTQLTEVFTIGDRTTTTNIQSVNPVKLSKDKVLVQWSISDLSFVDSFEIYKSVKLSSVKRIAGFHHALNNIFEFIDTVKPDEQDLLYSVVVRYIDGTSSEVFAQNKIFYTS